MTTNSPRQSRVTFDSTAMGWLLDGEHAAIRQRVRAILSRPSFRYPEPGNTDISTQREAVFRWCRELADEGIGALSLPQEYGGQDDMTAFLAAFETIAFHDISLTIKFTVQFGLWLGSVRLLGRELHHKKYLRAIGSFELPGCFAMTEIDHGSNVRELETLARFDPTTGGFIITSPNFGSGKNYIGNAVCHGRAAAVFAQLETADGKRHGVHAFVVPIRDDEGNILPGVRITDNGPKMGENGVDNGRIWFDGVQVGRDALLDRFGGVDAAGNYHSEIRSAGARFFTMISALVGGRISIALAGLSAAKSGLTIAVRYAARRRQFRAPGALEETALIDYPTHQRRLMPLLANAYALDFALKHLIQLRAASQASGNPADAREVERLAAALKAWTTWNTTRTLQTCREACGGEGYISANRLPALKDDTDIFTTFEGDNTVLMLWVGRNLLAAEADRADPAEVDGAGGKEASLLARRERTMREEVQAQFDRMAQEGVDSHVAASRLQMPLFHLAHAYVERVVLEAFRAGIERCEDGSLREVLHRLRILFMLTLVEQHRGWFLENEVMKPAQTKLLSGAIDTRCAALAQDAEALVEAFGIPAQCLSSPIAG